MPSPNDTQPVHTTRVRYLTAGFLRAIGEGMPPVPKGMNQLEYYLRVAAGRVRRDGGYGRVFWNKARGVAFYQSGDWYGENDVASAKASLSGIPGVESVEAESESLPQPPKEWREMKPLTANETTTSGAVGGFVDAPLIPKIRTKNKKSKDMRDWFTGKYDPIKRASEAAVSRIDAVLEANRRAPASADRGSSRPSRLQALAKRRDPEPDEHPEHVTCPGCDAENSHAESCIGALGSRRHYRCRFCGAGFSHKNESVESGARVDEFLDRVGRGLDRAAKLAGSVAKHGVRGAYRRSKVAGNLRRWRSGETKVPVVGNHPMSYKQARRMKVSPKRVKRMYKSYVSEGRETVSADHLGSYIDNDRALYHGQRMSMVKNLVGKMAAGKYNHDLAAQMFRHLADAGARKLSHELKGSADWHEKIPGELRKEVAKMLRDDFEREVRDGSYRQFVPAKYGEVDLAKILGESSHEERTIAGSHAKRLAGSQWGNVQSGKKATVHIGGKMHSLHKKGEGWYVAKPHKDGVSEERVLGRGMSAAGRRADIEQSDREYIAQRQAREKAKRAGDTRITVKKMGDEWVAAVYVGGKLDDKKTYYSGGGDASYKKDATVTAAKMRIDMGVHEARGPVAKGTSARKVHDEIMARHAAKHHTRPINRDEYPNREHHGLEGPYMHRKTGEVVYYDRKEGEYYDSKSDLHKGKDWVLESADLVPLDEINAEKHLMRWQANRRLGKYGTPNMIPTSNPKSEKVGNDLSQRVLRQMRKRLRATKSQFPAHEALSRLPDDLFEMPADEKAEAFRAAGMDRAAEVFERRLEELDYDKLRGGLASAAHAAHKALKANQGVKRRKPSHDEEYGHLLMRRDKALRLLDRARKKSNATRGGVKESARPTDMAENVEVRRDGLDIVLEGVRVSLRPTSLDEIKMSRVVKHAKHGTFGVLSAHHHSRSPAENKKAHKSLQHDVRKMGYGFTHVTGHYKHDDGTSAREKSLMVPKMHRRHLMHLAKKYGQESAIHSVHGRARAYYSDGKKADWSGKWKGVSTNVHKDDAHSQNKGDKRRWKFAESFSNFLAETTAKDFGRFAGKKPGSKPWKAAMAGKPTKPAKKFGKKAVKESSVNEGPGVSREHKNSIIRNGLKKMQQKLKAAGVEAVYSKQELTGKASDGQLFRIYYTAATASNAEWFATPVLFIGKDVFGGMTGMAGKNASFEKGLEALTKSKPAAESIGESVLGMVSHDNGLSPSASIINDLAEVAESGEEGRFGNHVVDADTADLVVSVHDCLDPENQRVFRTLPLEEMIATAADLVGP